MGHRRGEEPYGRGREPEFDDRRNIVKNYRDKRRDREGAFFVFERDKERLTKTPSYLSHDHISLPLPFNTTAPPQSRLANPETTQPRTQPDSLKPSLEILSPSLRTPLTQPINPLQTTHTAATTISLTTSTKLATHIPFSISLTIITTSQSHSQQSTTATHSLSQISTTATHDHSPSLIAHDNTISPYP
ncbi:hypothetical protein ACFE04_017615 [Oxalis oulophora]